MAAYTSSHLELPRGDLYKQGDTLTLGDGTLWRYTNGGGWVPNDTVTFASDLNGGIGIIGPDGKQIAGNAAPYAFVSRALADADNGMNLVCGSAQTATVNAGLPAGFGCSFDCPISFTAGAGVTITDLRTTGATDIFCGLMQVGANAYKVRGGKA